MRNMEHRTEQQDNSNGRWHRGTAVAAIASALIVATPATGWGQDPIRKLARHSSDGSGVSIAEDQIYVGFTAGTPESGDGDPWSIRAPYA